MRSVRLAAACTHARLRPARARGQQSIAQRHRCAHVAFSGAPPYVHYQDEEMQARGAHAQRLAAACAHARLLAAGAHTASTSNQLRNDIAARMSCPTLRRRTCTAKMRRCRHVLMLCWRTSMADADMPCACTANCSMCARKRCCLCICALPCIAYARCLVCGLQLLALL